MENYLTSESFPSQIPLWVLIVCLLFWISYHDVRSFEISGVPLLSLGLVAIFDQFDQADASWLLLLYNALLGLGIVAIFWLLGEIFFRKFGREGLGIGDAKLFGISVFLLGPASIPSLFFLSSIGGILAILTMRAFRNEPVDGIPFAPFISYAVIVIYFFGPIPF